MRYFILYRSCAIAVTLIAMYAGILDEAEAQVRRGNVSRANVNRVNVNRGANVNHHVNRTANVNQNVNVNRDVNVDVDRGWGGYNYPVATAAAVTAGVALTAAAIGSTVYSIPPSCAPVVVNGATFQQCGSTWYQPQYAGTQVTYVAVNPPQ